MTKPLRRRAFLFAVAFAVAVVVVLVARDRLASPPSESSAGVVGRGSVACQFRRNGFVAADPGSGVFSSFEGGVTWKQLTSTPSSWVSSPDGLVTLYASGGGEGAVLGCRVPPRRFNWVVDRLSGSIPPAGFVAGWPFEVEVSLLRPPKEPCLPVSLKWPSGEVPSVLCRMAG